MHRIIPTHSLTYRSLCRRGLALGAVAALLTATGCTDGGHSARRTATDSATAGGDTAVEGAGPQLSFTSSAQTVAPGGRVTLRWNGNRLSSCIASGAWRGARETSGQVRVRPDDGVQTYALSCSGPRGGIVREVTVRTGQSSQLAAELTADRSLIREGERVQLTWRSDTATSCRASGGDWTGLQPTSGSHTSPPLAENVTYQLRCERDGQTEIASVTVNVTDLTIAWAAPSSNSDGSRLSDLAGFRVHWGRTPRSYTSQARVPARVTEWEFQDLAPGRYYFSVTAINQEGDESGFSNEVEEIVP